MLYLMFINLMIMIIGFILLNLNFLLSKKKFKARNKLTPFECGFDTMSLMRMPFSINFFMISIIFLIFDIEISLLFPVIKTFNMAYSFFKNIFMIIMIILIIGLYYEWKEGSLKWLSL